MTKSRKIAGRYLCRSSLLVRLFCAFILLLGRQELQAQKPILSLSDSNLNIYMGGRIKVTSLISEKRTLPTGTAFILLPKDATGEESSFDVNARASNLWFKIQGPKIGSFKLGGMMLFFFTQSLTSETYGILPSLLYVDLTNDKWRFAAGQQMDVFATRIPNMVDNYFALAVSGCVGNSSRGQLRAERFVKTGRDGKITFTAALSEPITNYISSDFRNNTADAGVPNIEAALRYSAGVDPGAWVDNNAVELGVSVIKGTYRVFKNDANGSNIRVNKPNVWGVTGEYGFRLGQRINLQGEVYIGQALGNYLGDVFQSTKGDFDDEIGASGFWIEGAMYWKRNLQSRFGYGQDVCNIEDLKGFGIEKNQTFFVNVIWDLNRYLQLSAEPTYRKTSYLGLKDNSGFGIMLAAQFNF